MRRCRCTGNSSTAAASSLGAPMPPNSVLVDVVRRPASKSLTQASLKPGGVVTAPFSSFAADGVTDAVQRSDDLIGELFASFSTIWAPLSSKLLE